MKSINTNTHGFKENINSKDTNFKANIQFTETVINTEIIEPQRLVLIANLVWIKDQNGIVRQTKQGESYKVNIENGQISFEKPLKFISHGK
jgi:hypothetical protein